jgi:hypothetical protein
MSRVYTVLIDISDDNEVVVSGFLPRTNLECNLVARHHFVPPADGIWTYDLVVKPTALIGGEMLTPFAVKAPWIGDADANGVRIVLPKVEEEKAPEEIVLRKGKKVESFTESQVNMINITGAAIDTGNTHLLIDVMYGGGCFDHEFSLEWDGNSMKSNPPQYNMKLVDHSGYDQCKAIKRVQLRFDLNTADFQIDVPSTIHISKPGIDHTNISIELI